MITEPSLGSFVRFGDRTQNFENSIYGPFLFLTNFSARYSLAEKCSYSSFWFFGMIF